MSKCPIDGGKHTFTFILTGNQGDYEIYSYITCIGCGDQRAVKRNGQLIYFNTDENLWQPKPNQDKD